MDAARSHQDNGFHVHWHPLGEAAGGTRGAALALPFVSAGAATPPVGSTCCHAGEITADVNAGELTRVLSPGRAGRGLLPEPGSAFSERSHEAKFTSAVAEF